LLTCSMMLQQSSRPDANSKKSKKQNLKRYLYKNTLYGLLESSSLLYHQRTAWRGSDDG
jgi:hypothetical protein